MHFPFTRRFLRETLPGKGWWYFWGLFFLILTIATTTTIPQFIGRGIELLQLGDDLAATATGRQLARIGWQIVGLGVALGVFRVLSRIILFVPGRRAEAEVRQAYYDACVSTPPRYLSAYRTGDLVSRGSNDVASVRVMLSMGVLHTTNSFVMLGFCLYHMLRISGMLTLVCFMSVPLVAVAMRLLSNRMLSRSRQLQRELGTLTETIRELLRAHVLLSIYPVFDSLYRRFRTDNDRYRERAEDLQLIRIFLTNVSMSAASLATFILLAYGGSLVIRETISVGQLVEYSVYLGLIQEPLRAWGFLVTIMQRGEVCLERIFDIRDLSARVAREEATKPVTTEAGLAAAGKAGLPLVSIRDLTFKYPAAADEDDNRIAPFALNIDGLDLFAGRKYGVFGQTGAGKTTLLNVISGNLPVPPGSCFFNGIDYQAVTSEVLLRQFAIAAQDNRHFDGSIRQNLDLIISHFSDPPELGYQRTTFDDAFAISQLASDVEGFREGLDTIIGEHGVRLSGGQRQRLAILRALLKPRRLLLLDDIVSAVDHDTEHRILEALFSQLGDETMLIISHRISALTNCDEILILDAGRIVARGTHVELLARHQVYRATYQHQMIEQELLELEQ